MKITLQVHTIIHFKRFFKRKGEYFFIFAVNLIFLCILFYVNTCIFNALRYVNFPTSGMQKDTHSYTVCIALVNSFKNIH